MTDPKEAAILRMADAMRQAHRDAGMCTYEICARIAVEQGVVPVVDQLRRHLYESTQEDCELLARTRAADEAAGVDECIVIENAQNRLEDDERIPWDAVCAGEEEPHCPIHPAGDCP